MEFYAAGDHNNPLRGKVIGTEGSYGDNPERTKEKVFDGDAVTFFDAKTSDGTWVGLDLEHPRNIKSIRFMARTDYNIIVAGNLYEVFYWNNQWVSLGQKTATSHVLTYENVPSNALYFIKNHTAGTEERIFTYENGKLLIW